MMDDQSDANRIKSLIEWPNVIRNTSYRVMRLVFKFLYRHVSIMKAKLLLPRQECSVCASAPRKRI